MINTKVKEKMVCSYTKMVTMKDSGSTIKDMDKENIHGLLVIRKVKPMKVFGIMIKQMETTFKVFLKVRFYRKKSSMKVST